MTDMNDKPDMENLISIFTPFGDKRRVSYITGGGRLVHYTSAENALKIIQSRKLWMRNALCMNDVSEIQHGYSCLVNYFNDQNHKEAFFLALEPFGPDIAQKVFEGFNQRWPHILTNTFITCLSEHLDSEDQNGRLSMWRAYSRGATGAAIVLKPPPADSKSPLNLFLQPVAYKNQDELGIEIDKLISKINCNNELLHKIEENELIGLFFLILMQFTVFVKNLGFCEEREWRIIHMPSLFPSNFISPELESIGGVPQQVCKIDLRNQPQQGIHNVELAERFDRMIIGPTAFQFPTAAAFNQALTEAGVTDANQKIFASGTPLRL